MHKKIFSFISILFILISLTACNRGEKYSIQDKITEEIKYIENGMIGIIEEISISDSNNIDFDKLMGDTRKIEEASNRMMVDLASQNIDNKEITNFSDGINKMIIEASNQDEIRYLVELNNVFSLFPNFVAKISSDSENIFERRLKYYTVSSYISFLIGDKDLSKTQIYTLEKEYLDKQKDIKYVEEHKYNINKIYLLIEELKKAIENDNSELVKEKYLLLINEI